MPGHTPRRPTVQGAQRPADGPCAVTHAEELRELAVADDASARDPAHERVDARKEPLGLDAHGFGASSLGFSEGGAGAPGPPGVIRWGAACGDETISSSPIPAGAAGAEGAGCCALGPAAAAGAPL